MTKLTGYARASTRQRSPDRHRIDILTASVRRHDLYVNNGVSGVRASLPQFNAEHARLPDTGQATTHKVAALL
ncbi:hypothetical protein [Cryobacterium sp. Y82]|uniref:hypothetical protein n=1 Tax=Cryobacterium sp. Y82 TaxID=2045017 RepID=UPI0011B058BA